jgi:hypothetical protein
VHEHQERTGSARAREVLLDWARFRPLFVKVVPLGPGAPKPAPSPREQTTADATGPGEPPGGKGKKPPRRELSLVGQLTLWGEPGGLLS